jgi:hypothetical protein
VQYDYLLLIVNRGTTFFQQLINIFSTVCQHYVINTLKHVSIAKQYTIIGKDVKDYFIKISNVSKYA